MTGVQTCALPISMLIAVRTGAPLSDVTIDPLDQAALEKEYSDESVDPVLL